MDLFNRKQVADLTEALEDYKRLFDIQTNVAMEAKRKVSELQSSELALMVKIRDMDQLIFSMSQCSSWEEMRPIFLKLKTFTDERMIDESKRIQTALIPEMQKAYR